MMILLRRSAVAAAMLLALIGVFAEPAHAASRMPATVGAALSVTAAKPSAQDSFYMVNQRSNRCVEVPGYSRKSGAHVDQYTCVYNWHTNEMWYFQYVKRVDRHAVYEIINTGSGKCMNVAGASTSNGAAVVQWTCSRSAANGLWYIDEVGGYHVWRNQHSGKCLNVSGASKANGAWIIQYTCGNYRNEHWKYVTLCQSRGTNVCVQPPWRGW